MGSATLYSTWLKGPLHRSAPYFFTDIAQLVSKYPDTLTGLLRTILLARSVHTRDAIYTLLT